MQHFKKFLLEKPLRKKRTSHSDKKLNFLELHFQVRTKALEQIVRELLTTRYLQR